VLKRYKRGLTILRRLREQSPRRRGRLEDLRLRWGLTRTGGFHGVVYQRRGGLLGLLLGCEDEVVDRWETTDLSRVRGCSLSLSLRAGQS